jgi:hypothetical protein
MLWKRAALAASVVTLAMAGIGFVSAPANAAAASPNCVPNPFTNQCFTPTVSGTPWGTAGDNVRKTANAGAQLLTALPYGSYTTVYCYTFGSSVNDSTLWDFVDSVNGHTGYIADALLNTGGTVTGQVSSCVSGLTGH